MIRCRDIDRLASAYVDGELDDRRAEAFRGHMRQCGACRQSVHEMATMLDAASSLSAIEPPARLWRDIQRGLGEAQRTGHRRDWLPWRWSRQHHPVRLFAMPALALTLVVVAGWWSLRSADESPPRTAAVQPGDAHADKAETTPETTSNRHAPTHVAAASDIDMSLSRGQGTFVTERNREVHDTDRLYLTTIGELRQILDDDRKDWSPDLNTLFDQRLHHFEKAAHRHQQLLAMAATTSVHRHGPRRDDILEPSARDALYDVYRAEIEFLQRAAIDGPSGHDPMSEVNAGVIGDGSQAGQRQKGQQ